MIDHIVLNVKDVERSRDFYEAALAPLGGAVVKSFPGFIGFGVAGKTDFWIARRDPVSAHAHVAFTCANRKIVDGFHAAALKAGGRDNGAPGLRTLYHPDYYGAFVLDPDGNNIEVVCHVPSA